MMENKRQLQRGARGRRTSTLKSSYQAGERFEATWKFLNLGDSEWGACYSLFQTGKGYGFNRAATPHPLGAARRVAWEEMTTVTSVGTGNSAELTIPFTAPIKAGDYVCHWQLRDGNQNDVGYPVYLRITVPEALLPEAFEIDGPSERGTVPMPPYPFLESPLKLGMNVNPDDPNAYADPALLKGVGAVRLVFKLYEREQRFARQQWPTTKDYQQLVGTYMAAGIDVLFVLNQETVVPAGGWQQWRSLDRWTEAQWDQYVADFGRIAGQIAGSFKWCNERRPGSVSYQIWNEGDESIANALRKVQERDKTLEDAYTLPMDEKQYAKLLPTAADAIKRQDPNATVVAMGLVSGREPAAHYLWNCLKEDAKFLDQVDALAMHPYDCRPRGFEHEFPFANFDYSWPFHQALADVAAFARHVKGEAFPIWVTEIGPKPREATLTATLANYMRATIYDFAVLQPNVARVFWFPWADFSGSMEVSKSGIVDTLGAAKSDLWDAYEQLRDWLADEPVVVERPGQDKQRPQPEPIKPPKPPQPSSERQFDIWAYIVGKPGLAHGIRSVDGSGNEHNETVTTKTQGDKMLFIKNSVFETLWLEDFKGEPFIWRGLDTSPGNGRMYTVWLNGREGSPWCPRHMRIGEKWESPHEHWVQFYDLKSGQMSGPNSGKWRNRIAFYAHYPEMTFVNGVTIKDVIKLGWDGGEKYYYARDRGLVGWAREHHDPHTPQQSGVSEIHAPQRANSIHPIRHARYAKPPQA